MDYDYAFGFTRYKLNDLYQRGAKVVLISKKRMLDEKLFNDNDLDRLQKIAEDLQLLMLDIEKKIGE